MNISFTDIITVVKKREEELKKAYQFTIDRLRERIEKLEKKLECFSPDTIEDLLVDAMNRGEALAKEEVIKKLGINDEDLKTIRYDICQSCDDYVPDPIIKGYGKGVIDWCNELHYDCFLIRLFKLIKELKQ